VRRGLLLGWTAALACLVLPAAAIAAGPCSSPFDGSMSFQNIQGPDGPEQYCWEVNLGEEQALRQLNEREAEVYTTDPEHHGFSIVATLAHDAVGTNVPTTIEVVQPNVIVLTVHHRTGNPAASGAPFVYPVVSGAGWEGAFQTYPVVMPPPELPAPVSQTPAPTCAVPFLQGRTLKAARKALRRASCSLGPVWGEGGRGAKVVRQYRPAGKTLPAGATVGVKLAR
jgi:hypothetical protein